MTSSPDHAVIAVATSIPPHLVRRNEGHSIDDEYQKLCIRSWIHNGFRVLSVNDREEIPDLASRYPDVNFVPTERNASAWSGRKTPYIADLLLALKDVPESVLGIINSDILFEPSPAWRTCLPSLVDEAIVIGQRYNTNSLLRGVFVRYYDGSDFFFFDKTIARKALESAMPFALGLPWWDWWLPCVAAFNNRHILVVDRPSVVHLLHRQAFSPAVWQEFAHNFANFVIRGFEIASQAIPEFITTIVPVCQKIAALPREGEIDSQEYRRKISELGNLIIPLFRNCAGYLESNKMLAPDTHASDSVDFLDSSAALGAELTINNIFRRFDQRFAAGEALLRARKLLKENRLVEAKSEMLAAMDETPEDFNVLLTLGEIAFRRGKFQNAYIILSKAAEQRPDSARLLHLVGTVLHAMDRREEAVECFQKILDIDPERKGSYMALAKALWETNRRREAIAHLERAVEQWPHFAPVIELYDRFRKDFEADSAKPILPSEQIEEDVTSSYFLGLFSGLSGAISRIKNRPNYILPQSKIGDDNDPTG